MINTEWLEKVNRIKDPYVAAKEYLSAVSRYKDNIDTAINELVFEQLEYHFVEEWARIVTSVSNKQ